MIRVVTSFNQDGYDLYGRNFLEGAKHWRGAKLVVYTHDCGPLEGDFVKRSLHDQKEHEDFVKSAIGFSNQRQYKYDAHKFCHKVFALTDPLLRDADWLIWPHIRQGI